MQNTKIYPLIGLIMVFTALLVNHAAHRLQEAKPHLLLIETFPRQIGAWHSDPTKDEKVPVDVQKVLKTAQILQRHYTDTNGIDVVLLLLTASDYDDFHDPNVCFPGQGWNLMDRKTVNIDGQMFNSMVASRNADRLDVLFWMPVDPMATGGATLGKVRALRKLFSTENAENNGSLFVRMTTPEEANHREVMLSFARACKPYLDHLIAIKH